MEHLNAYWLEILFGLISAAIMWVIHRLSKEIAHYKELLENKENADFIAIVDDKLKPVMAQLDQLNNQMKDCKHKFENNTEQSVRYYGTILQDDCENYISRGYITHKEFNKLAELLHIYEELGGDGKIHDLYQKVMALPAEED